MSDAGDTPFDLDHLRTWIGRETTADDVLTADLVRKYRATLDLAGDDPQAGDAAPALIHFCLAQPAAPTATLGEDGHPARGGFLPPVPLPRRMWAGGGLEFHGPLRVGDVVRRASKILDVTAKEGRSGLLCFATVEHVISVEGQAMVTERQDIVYRGADTGGGAGKAPPAAEAGAHQRIIDPSAPLLFRYSALTFNGHRIHYDRPYTTGIEGYPGLVVHGPLQAAMLIAFATELRGNTPKRFDFRSQSPLYDTAPMVLNASEQDGGLTLWTARPDGPIAMKAEATW
tara:strand:+ start:116 stop:973 length:858 start_codon:yes stop_codon:yes gene_type:complete